MILQRDGQKRHARRFQRATIATGTDRAVEAALIDFLVCGRRSK
jgi:hypothetical protein